MFPRKAVGDGTPTIVVYATSTCSARVTALLADDFSFELCLCKLSFSEQRLVCNNRHRVRALVLRLFTKYVLNAAMHESRSVPAAFQPWADLQYTSNEFGKPTLLGGPHFNASSSNDVAAVVVQFNQNTPVGIDVSHELQDGISPTHFMSQFEGIFLPEETAFLNSIDSLPQRYVGFNQLWTLKEAFSKFLGTGLNVDLARASFRCLRVVQPSSSSELSWDHDIIVNTSQLAPQLQKITRGGVRCALAVVKDGVVGRLPVIMSLVHQADISDYYYIHIDMYPVLQAIVGV
ncbi:hypothetical protein METBISCDRAFT_19679 [Metschnikowia bicuspidata]|uniref:holo-[acyl-carrier-protein] synthase n=1 Tax=Metschnikowia bicuspidata TaxID=27322 RepID=A0A4P9Z8Y0_9ASCO|nr:hypothetical protein METBISCDRAFT_19679 [Metschnikowia bicuspidata]